MRFVIAGIVLVFVGFLVLGVFGHGYQAATLEAEQFGTCYEYSEKMPPAEINCSFKILDQVTFFGLVVGFIAGGIVLLVKGARGDWDSKVSPHDAVGPGNKQDKS